MAIGDDRELLLWPDGDLSRDPELWIRKGECNLCGACCEAGRPSYFLGWADDLNCPNLAGSIVAEQQWAVGDPVVAEAWGGEREWLFWQHGVPMDHTCPQYEGAGLCAVHGTGDQPDACRKFPLLPSDLEMYPGCSFRFVRCQ